MADSSSQRETRPSLLLRIRDGADQEAWDDFVTFYGPMVYRHCQRKGLQDADANDVSQEVFRKVLRSIKAFQYDPLIGRFRSWLLTIVNQQIWLFRQGNSPTAFSDVTNALFEVEAPDQDSEWEEDYVKCLLDRALQLTRPHFEDKTWRAFQETFLGHRRAQEVADMLECPVGRVYLAKKRVADRLKQEMAILAADTDRFS